MYFYLLLLTFSEFLGKIPLSFIRHFFESFRKGTPIFYCWLFYFLDEANFILHFIFHTFFRFGRNKKYSHLIFHTIFSFVRKFSLCKTPPSSIRQFFSIWTKIFLTINKFFTSAHAICKMTTKKGHDDTTEKSVYVMPYLDGQCSHPCGWI